MCDSPIIMRNRLGFIWLITFMIAVLGSVLGCGSNRHEFKEPMDVDFDMEDIAEPKEKRVSQYYDFVDRTFFKETGRLLNIPEQVRIASGSPKQAENIDAFGDVPNSSWFTNRNGRRSMSLQEIRKGPNTNNGPAEGTWTVVKGKTQGVTPGFTIKDPLGERYIIKFDTVEYPQMSTAAEIISSKLFYAMGYNTTENTLIHFTRDQLVVGPEAEFVDVFGNERRMTEEDLDRLLTKVSRREDETYRAVASKFLGGVPKGPYSYYGTRSDDPNDIIRHEHRRELRGLSVMAAWLEHNDVRRINSLDMYVTENGRRFIKHYLIDFGATLGSASLFPNLPSEGHEYQFDISESLKSLFTLGIYKRRWLDAGEPEFPSVGYFESALFDPANWKPNYPVPAFQRMTTHDAYWATKIVMSFTDAQIRAAVETGALGDKAAEEYLIETLLERRDKIGRYWYAQVNPLDLFSIEGEPGRRRLHFTDLEAKARFVDLSGTTYRYQLIHNACDNVEAVTASREVRGSEAAGSGILLEPELKVISEPRPDGTTSSGECDGYYYLAIWTKRDPSSRDWGKWVRVHLYRSDPDTGFEIIGVEHEG